MDIMCTYQYGILLNFVVEWGKWLNKPLCLKLFLLSLPKKFILLWSVNTYQYTYLYGCLKVQLHVTTNDWLLWRKCALSTLYFSSSHLNSWHATGKASFFFRGASNWKHFCPLLKVIHGPGVPNSIIFGYFSPHVRLEVTDILWVEIYFRILFIWG